MFKACGMIHVNGVASSTGYICSEYLSRHLCCFSNAFVFLRGNNFSNLKLRFDCHKIIDAITRPVHNTSDM